MTAIPEFTCFNCGSHSSKIKYHFKEDQKKIIQCASCGIMVLDPFPTEEALKSVYNDLYFNNDKLVENSSSTSNIYGYSDYIAERINKQRGYNHILEKTRSLMIASAAPPPLLDYGCGLGFFIDSAYDYGFDPNGVEFNPYAIDYIRRRYSYKVFKNEEFGASEKKYDVVTLFDVIEHVRDPLQLINDARTKLNDNGLLILTTMDSESIVSKMIGSHLKDFRRTSEHIYFFSRKNLPSLMMRYGFEILEIASHGHSFELNHLVKRVNTSFPAIACVFSPLLKIFPFLGRINIYVNPFTKFILYARKRNEYGRVKLERKKLTIVVPVYNEQLYIKKILEKLLAVELGLEKEIIVVNDGSVDGTADILREYESPDKRVKIIHKINEGKGSAVAKGIQASTGDFVIIQDADLEYNPEDIPLLLDVMIKTGANVVYGSRYRGKYRKAGYFINTVANNFLTFLTNLVNNLNLSDMETGYKLFNGNLIRSIKISSKRFDFEPEITCKVSRYKTAIYEVPISYNARTYYEGKKIKFKDGVQAIFAIIKYGVLKFK